MTAIKNPFDKKLWEPKKIIHPSAMLENHRSLGAMYTNTGVMETIGSFGTIASGSFSVTVTVKGTTPYLAGSLVVVSFYSGTNNVTVNTPAGWNRIEGGWGVSGSMWTFYRLLTGGDPTTQFFSFSGGMIGGWCSNEFTGVSGEPPDVYKCPTTGLLNEMIYPTFTIDRPSMIYVCNGSTTSTPIPVFSPGGYQQTSDVTRIRPSYKFYPSVHVTETVTVRSNNYPTTLNAMKGELYRFNLKYSQ